MSTNTDLATGALAHLALTHLPDPSGFDHERILLPDAPRAALADVEAELDEHRVKALTVRTDGPQPVRIVHDGPPRLYYEDILEPSGLRYGTLSSWDDFGDFCTPNRLWISDKLSKTLTT